MPYAALITVTAVVAKWDVNRMKQPAYSGNGLRKLTLEQYRQQGAEATKRELERLKQSAQFKQATMQKGYGKEQWNWQSMELWQRGNRRQCLSQPVGAHAVRPTARELLDQSFSD